jgi:hypothetical protein
MFLKKLDVDHILKDPCHITKWSFRATATAGTGKYYHSGITESKLLFRFYTLFENV